MKHKFSIVTVVLNRREWIRDAIESVLGQQYAAFEHIVIDGGSTDGTLKILEEYPHLKWLSEKDNGSCSALNKGLAMISGDIFGWLNSDETYMPGTFERVDQYFQEQPDWAMLYGATRFVDDQRRPLRRSRVRAFNLHHQILGLTHIPAPSAMFLRRSALEAVGGRVDERWRDAYDHDLWIRVGKSHHVQAVPECFSTFAIHSDSGVSAYPERALRELAMIRKHHDGERRLIDRLFFVPLCNLYIWSYVRFRWPGGSSRKSDAQIRPAAPSNAS